MKKIYLTIIMLTAIITSSKAQTRINIGGGYFGQTATHPGIVLEYEMERMYSEKASLPVRFDAGFYSHPRNHYGIFADVSIGFRRYFKSGLFLEESIGIGVLETAINSDGIYSVDDNGNVTEVSGFNPPDLMPSITLGIGYNLTKGSSTQNLLWFRPKIYWQYPHKTSSTFNPAIQLGFTHTIKTK